MAVEDVDVEGGSAQMIPRCTEPRAPGTIGEVVRRVRHWLALVPPESPRFARLRDSLRPLEGDTTGVTARTLHELERTIHPSCRHLTFDLDPLGDLEPADSPPGWERPSQAEVQARAAWISDTHRTEDGIFMFRIDNLDPIEHAAPFLEAAFALGHAARGVVVDLRNNGGGDVGTLTQVISWLMGDTLAHISSVQYRTHCRQWWTTPRSPECSVPREVAACVLVGSGTYSSGEALAYHLQSLGRVSVVGSRTAGAADHVTPVALTRHVRALIPEGVVTDPRTNASWEACGVLPDLECPEDDAPQAAFDRLRGAW